MSEEVGVKIVRIVYDASKAREGAAQAKRSLEEIERQAVQTGGVIGRMEGTLGSLGAGFSKVARFAGIFGVALSVAGATSFARDITQYAGGLATLAEQLTTNTRYLQGIQFAATGANTKLEDLEKGAAAFALKIGQASEGNKDAIETFQRLGVKILDIRGNVRPFNDLLTESAQKLGAVENANVKTALSTEVFDKAGRKMLTLLPELAKGQEHLAEQAEKAGASIKPETIDKWDKLGSTAEQSFMKWKAFAAENFFEPVSLGFKVIAGAIELTLAPLRALIWGIDKVGQAGDWLGKKFTTGPNTGGGTPEENEARVQFEIDNVAGQPGAGRLVKKLGVDKDRVNRVGGQGFGGSEPIGLATAYKTPTVGGLDPTVKGAGDGDRIAKLQNTLRAAAEAQDVMTAAALRGGVAFQEQEIRAKSLEQAMQAYGDKLDRNHPKVKALAAEIEQFNRRVIEGKVAEAFALQTTELSKQNEILSAELRLLNEFPEVRARELAMIRARQEAEKGGKAVTAEMLEQRRAVIEQNETLKIQQEDLRRSQELWTEPFKQALRDIQSLGADMFDSMLERGSFSFNELGNIARTVGRRIVSELASLAIIRPMVGSLAGALGDIGILSGSSIRQLGFGGGASGGGAGGGGFSMPSFGGGGFGSMFGGGIGDWLNTPFTGAYAGMSPSSMQGVPMLSGAAGAGITPLGAFGAAAGIGMGAYQLATSKSTAGTIGGIGTMLGAGISLIPGMAPVGMGISLLSSILPGLFGGGEAPPLPPLAGSNLRFTPGAGGYSAAESFQNGGASQMGQYGGVAGTINALYAATGGTVDYGLATGGAVWNNQREGTTSTYAIHPTLGSLQMSEGGGDQSAAVDRMIAKMFYMTATTPGALTGASPTLGTALGHRETTSTAEIQSLLGLVDAYDKLGKVTPSAEAALKEINASFDQLAAGARDYGLALAPIEAEQAKATKRYAQDFIDGMLDPLAVQLRALDDQRKDSIASAEYIRDNVSDVYVDMARISDYWLRKEAELKEQLYGGAVKQLEDAVRRLTYGDLANLGPTGTLAGMEAAFDATTAQARAGDASAIGRLAAEGQGLAEAGRSYFASGPEYEALKREILDILLETQSRIEGGGSAGGALNENNQATQVALATVSQLTDMVKQQADDATQLRRELRELKDLMQRVVSR